MKKLQIIKSDFFKEFKEQIKVDISLELKKLKEIEFIPENFNFYNSLSSIFSSKIEGETMEVDSYLKYRQRKGKQLKITKKVDDLVLAYEFAQSNKLTVSNFLKSHKILSKNLPLEAKERGKIRTLTMYIQKQNNKIVYISASKEIVKEETKKLFADINILLNAKLSFAQIFYFASMIHLVFVTIHPMTDGNGRSARLLEKWFLAEKLGQSGWYIRTEKYYFRKLKYYYKFLFDTQQGKYEKADYSKSIPFLMMLVNSLKQK